MKKLGAILTTLALIMTLSASVCFADSGLTILNTYPEDGSKGASIENLGVKIEFSNDLSEKVVGKANKNCFKLYDEEGKELPIRVLYNDKREGEVLVLLDTVNHDVRPMSNSEYTLVVSEDTVDDEGNALGKEQKIVFKTLNQSVNTMISMGMMVVMFGGIMIVSAKSAKKAAEEEMKAKQEKVNPYKEAKKTGKSVEEIVEKDQKRKAKEAAKAAKKAAAEDDYYDEEDINKYRVSRRHSAGKAGSKYVAAQRAAAEAKKAQNAKKSANSKKKK